MYVRTEADMHTGSDHDSGVLKPESEAAKVELAGQLMRSVAAESVSN